jgi:hypothetical protein
VILRNLNQESPDLELRLKIYEGLKFGGQNWNFGKSQGYICEYTELLVDWNVNLGKMLGLLCKIGG